MDWEVDWAGLCGPGASPPGSDLAAVADILASRVVAKVDLLLDSVDPAESVVPVVPLLDTVDRVQAAVERVAVRLHQQAVRPSE